MTIEDEILAIANQLANKGQKPTIALVKPKLSKSVPLPILISVLKLWQHDPDFIKVNNTTNSEIGNNLSEKVTQESNLSQQIELAIAPLRAEIGELKKLIEQLINDSSKGH